MIAQRETISRSEDSRSYHKARDLYISAVTHILERYLSPNWYRETLRSEGIAEAKVKEWEGVAEGSKREHVATVPERRPWSKTYFLKQKTAGGPGTIATTKHPIFFQS